MQASQTTHEQIDQDSFSENALMQGAEAFEEETGDEISAAESVDGSTDIEDPAIDSAPDTKGTDTDIQVDEEAQINETDISSEAELEALREEVRTLKAALKRSEKLKAELMDFAEVFPEQDIHTLPDEVWQDVRKGNSLAAAFALFERKKAKLEAHAAEVNQINANRSSGRAGSNCASEFFSPDDVRAMSQSEVRANYSRIIESMKKWN